MQRIYNEIEVLKQLRHQNICQLYQVIETETHVYLVMEVIVMLFFFGFWIATYIVLLSIFLVLLRGRTLRLHCFTHPSHRSWRPLSFSSNSVCACLHTQERDCSSRLEASKMWCYDDIGFVHSCFFLYACYENVLLKNSCLFPLLKENLLLDEDQNCKLIDFGLCAQPKVWENWEMLFRKFIKPLGPANNYFSERSQCTSNDLLWFPGLRGSWSDFRTQLFRCGSRRLVFGRVALCFTLWLPPIRRWKHRQSFSENSGNL